jgi:hypothetical protein
MTKHNFVSTVYGAIKEYSYSRDGFEGMLLEKHMDALVMLEDVSSDNSTSVYTREVSLPYVRLLEILSSGLSKEDRERFLEDFRFDVNADKYGSDFVCDSKDTLYRHRALLAILKDAHLISLHDRSDDIDRDSFMGAFAMYNNEPYVYINSALNSVYDEMLPPRLRDTKENLSYCYIPA